MALTAPGQTAAVSAFVDPMLAELGMSRTALSTAYLVGTLTGAAAMPLVGRALDTYGVRGTMAAVGVVFGAFLLGLSFVTGIVGVTAGFVASAWRAPPVQRDAAQHGTSGGSHTRDR